MCRHVAPKPELLRRGSWRPLGRDRGSVSHSAGLPAEAARWLLPACRPHPLESACDSQSGFERQRRIDGGQALESSKPATRARWIVERFVYEFVGILIFFGIFSCGEGGIARRFAAALLGTSLADSFGTAACWASLSDNG
jgi:hypothetical protein